MTTFYLSQPQILAVASLAVAGTREPFTPILGAIQLTVTPSTVTAVATDRYMIAELTFPLGETVHTLPADGVTLLIDSVHLVSMSKDKAGFTFTFDQPEEARESYPITAEGERVGIVKTFPSLSGNFPPVGRLFAEETPDDLPNGTLLNMARLGRVAKLILPGEKSAAAAAKEPWEISYKVAEGHKSAPVQLTRSSGTAAYRVLVQPNMRTR